MSHYKNRLIRLTLGLMVVMLLFVGLWGLNAMGSGESVGRAYREDSLIRLHVVANSDQPMDQYLKLLVRDLILTQTGELFSANTSWEEAWTLLEGAIPQIEEAAAAFLAGQGYPYPVRGELGSFSFPERVYGNLTLPPGRYHALRFIIGEGKGENWWCVLFPTFCGLDPDSARYLELAEISPEELRAAQEEGRVPVKVRWSQNCEEPSWLGRIRRLWQRG